MATPSTIISPPAKNIQGEMIPPGDKSISHRSIFLTSLGKGKSKITNFLSGEDCQATAKAFQAMGVHIDCVSPTEMFVQGKGKRSLKKPDHPLDLGNSGTTMRLLSGVCAGLPYTTELTGDDSLNSRPMKRVVDPLTQMGGQFSGPTQAQTPPLTIKGGALKGMRHQLKIASAQVKSSLLLAGLYAQGETTVVEPLLTRDHTERMLQHLGVKLKFEGLSVTIDGEQEPTNRDLNIPGDISSAAFFIVAAALFPKSHFLVRNVGLNPTRCAFLDVLQSMGANIQIKLRSTDEDFEPYGDIEIKGQELSGTEISGEWIPNLIDEIPILAVAGALAHGKTVIRDAKELRVKESDRIKTITGCLRQLGAQVEELPDGMIIEGPTKFKGGISIPSSGDHRIAMSMAIAGLFCQKEIQIEDTDCIQTSFPQFPKILNQVGSHA